MSFMQSQAQYVLRTVEERGVRFVQLWFTDVLGRHKAFHVTPAELEDALDQGMTFDGSAIDGFSRVQESDVLARPDLTTFQLLPWYEEGAGVARVFCDIVNIDGTPFEGCPRQRLRRVLDSSRQQGYTFFVAPEIEFFYFRGLDVTENPQPIDRGSYFDLLPDDTGSQLRRHTVLTLE
ncbi:MAG TPA: glutamine synthetase beta-grasp domain-containing protein, partial [Acidimicrobiales bacterium]|nr:glutamine synthetase beta-grasp domain-containing protein [Acidimicrobiales bacterium]